MFCPKCGKEIPDGSVFCPNCGFKIQENVEAKGAGQLLIPQSIYDSLPAMVRNEMAKLSATKQEEFVQEYRRRAKSSGVAYVLWFLLGWHYVYLRGWGIQFLFWLTAGGLGIWWFIDLFRIPGMVKEYNKNVAIDIMRDLKIISS
jgi:hypothetical protein